VNHFAGEGRCFINALFSIPEKILQIKQAFRFQGFYDVFAPPFFGVMGFCFQAYFRNGFLFCFLIGFFSYCLCTSFWPVSFLSLVLPLC